MISGNGNYEKKTLSEWAALDGLIILDPDGFDRKDPDLMMRKFSKDEYVKGLPFCTVIGKTK